jgi:UDP-N-acetylglucosamine 2-epimerase (non-hydrolysing)
LNVLITMVAGARPNFMKIAPLTKAFADGGIRFRIVHTGQHYDVRMSQTFFEELGIPAPDVNLEVGSGSHSWQIAEVLRRIEPELDANRPDAVLVVGDVNSTLAAAIAAVKLGIPLAHVEAGLRSFDRAMPEETNRVLTDAISRWLFTSEPSGEANLLREGVPAERIHFVGNVMIDTLRAHRGRTDGERVARGLGLEPKGYAVMTLHRPSNVDDAGRFGSILRAVRQIAAELPVVFVVHPRTRARLGPTGLVEEAEAGRLLLIEPLGYLAMLGLMDASRFVLTDSGGIQEETTALGVPCLTLRENTERPVTIEVGCNRLVGWRSEAIVAATRDLLAGSASPPRTPDKWDGRAAERIAAVLSHDLQQRPDEP